MKLTRTIGTVLATIALSFSLQAAAAEDSLMDPELRSKGRRAADYGMHYLRQNQAEDGSWSKSVGITALALRAFLESHRGYNTNDGAFITRPIGFLLAHARKDGAISESLQNTNYNTSAAIAGLVAARRPEYEDAIRNAQNFLKGHQIDEEEGYAPDHAYYGGIGYGGDERPDLSNMYMAIEALSASKLAADDPTWAKALTFIQRTQNRSESNDQPWAANDGGFTYMPGWSPHGGSGSYGGMTHAGLFSLMMSGVAKSDPRVKAAFDWVRANYTVDENPGARNNDGLFYYYNAFAKSLYVYGEKEIVDSQGIRHNWRNDLVAKLLSMQAKDGSWVNPYSRQWGEGDKNLVTAWAIIALNLATRSPSDDR